MHSCPRARCAALMTDPASLRAAGAVEVLDGTHGVIREAMVLYSVSPGVANAAEVLAAGLRRRIHAWKELAGAPG